jgi:hypothetical protein
MREKGEKEGPRGRVRKPNREPSDDRCQAAGRERDLSLIALNSIASIILHR